MAERCRHSVGSPGLAGRPASRGEGHDCGRRSPSGRGEAAAGRAGLVGRSGERGRFRRGVGPGRPQPGPDSISPPLSAPTGSWSLTRSSARYWRLAGDPTPSAGSCSASAWWRRLARGRRVRAVCADRAVPSRGRGMGGVVRRLVAHAGVPRRPACVPAAAVSNGLPPTARWWAVGWLAAGLGGLYLLVIWFDPGTVTLSGLPIVSNPTGIRGLDPRVAGQCARRRRIASSSGYACLLAAASVFVRYRRSAGEERLQLKWFAYAAVLSLALLVVLLPVSSASEERAGRCSTWRSWPVSGWPSRWPSASPC